MSGANRIPKFFVWTVPTIALFAVAAALIINWAKCSRADLPVIGTVPRFALTERGGIEISQDSLKGRLTVVDFFFTTCRSVCPIMNGNMSELYKLYSNSDKVRFLSITVDPDRDSLETLQRYADSLGVSDNRWLFVRGALLDVAHLMEKGFMLAADELPSGHPTQFVLIDDKLQIRGYYSGDDKTDIEVLKTHIRELARQMP